MNIRVYSKEMMIDMEQKRERNNSCCFTGHRNISSNKIVPLTVILENEIEKLISIGVKYFYCGGALGFDTLAAKTILKLKDKYDIQLIIVIPHSAQDNSFTKEQKEEYNQILDLSDDKVCLSNHYYNGCMQKRNRYIVDNSNYCICYLIEEKGGTAYTVTYAKKHNLNMINTANLL